MKKLFLLMVMFCVICGLGFGFEKGTKSVGGSVGFSTFNGGEDSLSFYSLYLSPSVSYFVVDGLSVDISPTFGVSWAKNVKASTDIGIGIGSRYFYKFFYGGFMYRYSQYGQPGEKTSMQYLDLKAGYMFGVAKNIYLNTGLVYTMGLGKLKYGDYSSDNDFSRLEMSTGISIFFK